jgi:transposase
LIRTILTDAQWERIAPLLPGKEGDPGRSGGDNRAALEGMLWIVRTGAPWRDLPECFGKWFSVWKRFRRWALRGVFDAVFKVRRAGFRIRAHRRHHREGPPARNRRKRGTLNQAIGKSRGGLTTKVVALVDALGNLVRFILLPGQRHDSVGVAPLITDIEFAALIADKAFDNNALRTELIERSALAVIPSKADRKAAIAHDAEIYKWRHLIENCFQRLKEFRRIATRYDKTDTSFAAALHLVATFLALR